MEQCWNCQYIIDFDAVTGMKKDSSRQALSLSLNSPFGQVPEGRRLGNSTFATNYRLYY